jgi:hypothetical protein
MWQLEIVYQFGSVKEGEKCGYLFKQGNVPVFRTSAMNEGMGIEISTQHNLICQTWVIFYQ